MRHTLLAAFVLTGSIAGSAFASDMNIPLDEVRTITFGKPVATVYVGNPTVADINMIDARHAFILGKGYGSTNVVALNHDGAQVSNTRISVMSNPNHESTLVLNRGASRITYNCTADHCDATPRPGDGKDAFESGNSQIAAHETAAKAAANPQ